MSFTVVYDPNGATGGTPPKDTNVYSILPTSANHIATILLPDASFVSGSDTFAHWNSAADGSGNLFGERTTGVITSTVPGVVTLYAQWYTVSGLTNNGLSSKNNYQLTYERYLSGPKFNLEPARTNTFLSNIESDHKQLVTWFGGVDYPGFIVTPVPIRVCNVFGGARSGGPGGTYPVVRGILMLANGLDFNGLRYLMYSEVSEFLMQIQNKGWFGDGDEQSSGEALSRFLAAQFLNNVGITLSNPAYSGYQTSVQWLNSSLPSTTSGSTQLGSSLNQPIGTLVSDIDSSTTSVTVTGQFTAPYETTFVVQVDNEQMLVTSTSPQGTTNEILNVQRGYNGTPAVSHTAVESSNPTNVWFNYEARKDYVNTVLDYDILVDASVGCATLFLYYLNIQLGFTPQQICTAAQGSKQTCLRDVYTHLTSDSSDPFPFFKSLLDAAFPADQVSVITGPNPDNPWPLGSLSFWGVKNIWGHDEVSDILKKGGVYQNAFWLMLEGFSQSVVGSTVPVPPTIAFQGATAVLNGPTIYETSNDFVPQHIRFAYDMHFDQSALASFPGTGETTAAVTSQITLSSLSVPFPTLDDFYFVAGAAPYFTNVLPTTNPADENYPWLSADIRVFTATPLLGGSAPVPGGPPFTTDSTSAAYNYISALIPYLNQTYGDPNGKDPFAANSNVILNEQYSTDGDSSVTPYVTVGSPGAQYTNYNFAIARVRLQGTPGPSGAAQNVRVFFRVWGTQTADVQWDPTATGTYAHLTDASGNILGPVAPPSNHTIPFFATENLDLTNPNNLEYGPSGTGVNNRIITIEQGDSQWTYFGCFLDLYNTSIEYNNVEVAKLFPGTHHCLVAELNYAGTPIQSPSPGVLPTPENSAQLAQRNLQVTPSDNPGGPAAHRIPQTFDMAPSPGEGLFPDELMIDWGDVPVGSIASIYWPQLQADDVIQLANSIYGYHALSAADNNTIQCTTVKGASYIPIISQGRLTENIAGLFTIDLPTTVVKGQAFNVVVRRLRARELPPPVTNPPPPPVPIIKSKKNPRTVIRDTAATPSAPQYSRSVLGSFNIRIPVATAATLLRPEADTLAIMKARLNATATTSRWYPVLVRYIGYLSGRVDGLGGSASGIPPSFGGAPIILPEPGQGSGRECCYTGKVTGICYDGDGSFEGFLLAVESCEKGHPCHTQECKGCESDDDTYEMKAFCCKAGQAHEHRFNSTGKKIYELVERAWCHGTLIMVCVRLDKPRVVTRLVLRGPVEAEQQ